MENATLDLNTCTTADIIAAAKNEPTLMNWLGGSVERIEERANEDFAALTKWVESWARLYCPIYFATR